jgi:hypothetical protein
MKFCDCMLEKTQREAEVGKNQVGTLGKIQVNMNSMT